MTIEHNETLTLSRTEILKDRTLRRLATTVAVLALMITVSVITLWVTYNAPRIEGVTITACTPADYDKGFGTCPDGSKAKANHDPEVFSEDLEVEVKGDVFLNKKLDAVSYGVNVSWFQIGDGPLGPPGLNFTVVDAPVTWGLPRQPYEVVWSPPAEMIEAVQAANLEPGTSLGRWKIVGTATPVRPNEIALYQWDSVGGFELILP